MPAALAAHLEPGETLRHWAYGVKQPHVLVIIGLYALAILPGIIGVALMTREYVVGMTDRRFIVLRFKSGAIRVEEVLAWPLDALPPARTSTGALFTHIALADPARPFAAKFHRLGMEGNRANAMAMGAALTGRPSPLNASSGQAGSG